MSAALAQMMAAALPEASVVTVTGAGHDVHLDQPIALAEELLSFMP